MTKLGLLGIWTAAALLLCCCVITQPVAQNNPPTPPTSPTEAELPKDNTKAVPQDGSNGWTKLTPRAGEAAKAARAKKVKVSIKAKAQGGMPGEKLQIRKIGYYKKNTTPPQYVEADVVSVGSGNGKAANIDIPADADTSKAIYVKVYTVDASTNLEVIPAECPLNKNFVWLDDGAAAIVSIEHGGSAVCSVDGEEPTTLFELAAETLELSAGDHESPDLMFWCTDLIETGELLFCPIGQFKFSSLPEAVHIVDATGADLVQEGLMNVGEWYITPRGDLALPIEYVSEELPAFGMIVRGVAVDMDDNADGDSVHCYTTGGTALRYLQGDTCAIAQGTRVLDNWEVLGWSAGYGLSSAVAPVGEEQTVLVQSQIVTTVSGTTNSGYLNGIVIAGNVAGSIRDGHIILRGVSGWQFDIADGNGDTRLYILNANTGADLYHEGIAASIRVTSHGDLKISLGNLATHCAGARLKLVVTGVRTAFTAPVPWGVGYKLELYGSALRTPLKVPQVILEGESPNVQAPSVPSGPLPQEAIVVSGWTPVAVSD